MSFDSHSAWLTTGLAFCIGLSLLAPAAGGAEEIPGMSDRYVRQQVSTLLAEAMTRDALEKLTEAEPFACVDITSTDQLCQWNLGKRQPIWKPLARALETRHTVALVCELPKDGTQRSKNTCQAFPRASNRNFFRDPSGGKANRLKRRKHAQRERELRGLAGTAIEQAETMSELVALIGAIPESCALATGGNTRLCSWRLTNRTLGHGTVAASIDVVDSKRLRFDCELPSEGGPRKAGSCRARISGQ